MDWALLIKSKGINLIYAALILIIGLVLATYSKRWARKKVRNKSKDPTVKLFAINVAYATALVVIFTSALGRLGVPTESLLTIIGAGGLAIALSLKNSLSNVANGFIIISMKLLHVGDLVEINGTLGKVYQINLFNTKIITPNNDLIIIPNSKALEHNLRIKGAKGVRRIDLTVGISYDSSILKAKSILLDLINQHESILKNPSPLVAVKELADSAVILIARPWVNKSDYTNVLYDLTEKIKLAFDDNGITIPFPQVDAHLSPLPPSEATTQA